MKPFQIELFEDKDLLTIREASKWAGKYLNKKISESNISYLVQYGKVRKRGNNTTLVSKKDLRKYYKSFRGEREGRLDNPEPAQSPECDECGDHFRDGISPQRD